MKEGIFMISGFPVRVKVLHEGKGKSEIETLQMMEMQGGIQIYPGLKARVPSGMVKAIQPES